MGMAWLLMIENGHNIRSAEERTAWQVLNGMRKHSACLDRLLRQQNKQ